MATHLLELPLPKDWDRRAFKIRGQATRENIDRAINVARQHAKEIGSGLDRNAYLLTYQNRPTVLKIPNNPRGGDQMKYEITMLFKRPDIKASPLFIKGIDYDRSATHPMWIHVEYARPCTQNEFRTHMSTDPDVLVDFGEEVWLRAHKRPSAPLAKIMMLAADTTHRFGDINLRHPTVIEFANMSRKYDLGDSHFNNWGWYQDRLVIIDLGYVVARGTEA